MHHRIDPLVQPRRAARAGSPGTARNLHALWDRGSQQGEGE